ncbi:CHAT domain-containing protein [Kitasatospora sp. NBC_01560]|uniref:CHAT domain-containing protein n=1 Tax=Kitasatospora sp. NBC_01560 TaxID=2975965 RepID=UPI0038659F6F
MHEHTDEHTDPETDPGTDPGTDGRTDAGSERSTTDRRAGQPNGRQDERRDDPAVQAVLGLVRDVHAHHLSETAAVALVRDPAWVMTEQHAAFLTLLSDAHARAADPSGGYLLARLVLEAADVRWGRSRESMWWAAADRVVECARLLLVTEPDGARFRHACAVADEQIGTLRADRELEELAETMFAAGLLRVHPFTGIARAGLPPEELLARQRERETLRRPFARGSDPDGLPHGMPDAAESALDALPYLYGAVGLSEGHRRGRCLVALGEALALLAHTGMGAPWIDEELLRSARQAVALLDPAQDPYNRIKLMRLLSPADRAPDDRAPDDRAPDDRAPARHVPAGPRQTVHDLLGGPVADLVRRLGGREAGAVVDQALCLFREQGDTAALRALLDEAHAALPHLDDPERCLEIWESEVHALPGSSLPCPVDAAGAELLLAAATAAGSAGIDGNDGPAGDAWARPAAALHLAAHLYHRGDARFAQQLVRRAWSELPADAHAERVLPALVHLRAAVASRAALEHAGAGRPMPALQLHGQAAEDYAALGLADLAVQQLDHLVAGAGTPDAAVLAAVILRQSTAPALSAIPRADVGFALYRAGQRLPTALGTHQVSPGALFEVVTAVKGLDFGAALAGHRGPRAVRPGLHELLGEIGRAEGALPEAGETHRLTDLAEDLHMLCYAGAQETDDGADARSYLDNLRRGFDRAFSRWLYGARGDAAARDRRHAADLDELCRALPPDTVLLTLFVGLTPPDGTPDGTPGEGPAAPDGAPATVAHYLVTLTRDGVADLRLVASDGVPAALHRIAKDGYSHTLHPFATTVADVRAAVLDDPLHRPVGREAEERLALEGVLGAGLADTLDRLHAEGRRHLCVWAHGPFHYLPFHLLHSGGRPLADRWTVTTVPSPVCLTAPPAHPPGTGLLALGAAHGGAARGLPAEPELDAHVRSVAAEAGGTALTGADATPQALLARAPGHRYLHIAAHGSHSPVAPWFQCLYLNPPQPDTAGAAADAPGPAPEGAAPPHGPADGRLFAHQVVAADLRGVELVTLGACESALGRFDLGDNLRGLPAAFLLAGAKAVVGCLWPVEPEAATCFFTELYRALGEDVGPVAAFRLAQQATRLRHPQYRDWGAFSYSGSLHRSEEGTD